MRISLLGEKSLFLRGLLSIPTLGIGDCIISFPGVHMDSSGDLKPTAGFTYGLLNLNTTIRSGSFPFFGAKMGFPKFWPQSKMSISLFYCKLTTVLLANSIAQAPSLPDIIDFPHGHGARFAALYLNGFVVGRPR